MAAYSFRIIGGIETLLHPCVPRIPALALVLLAFFASPGQAVPPNILLIIADDHGATDYSFQGHPDVQTPHIDRLARQSLTFTAGYVPSSLCCPSLASLITGLYPHQHRITSNDPPLPAGMTPRQFYDSSAFRDGREIMNRHLEAVPTLPRLLAARHYASLQTGKWWQGHFSRGGFTQGMTQGERHGDQGLVIGRHTMQPIHDFVRQAKRDQQPFFIWYAPMMPHAPHTPPDELLKKYQSRTDSLHLARYWAMIEWFDSTVGDLLDLLDAEQLAQDTIVDLSGRQRLDSKPARSCLRSALEAISLPGRTAHAHPAALARPSAAQDLGCSGAIDRHRPHAAYCRGRASHAADAGVEPAGRSGRGQPPGYFWRVLHPHGRRSAGSGRQSALRWVIADHWKLIVPHPANEPTAVTELYNLADDPGEAHNLRAEKPDVAARLSAQLDAWWNPDKR